MRRARSLPLALGALLAVGCAWADEPGPAPDGGVLEVTATAYNSVPGQTHGNPRLGAWGDRIEPGMRVVAVSPDLLDLGLTRGARLRIEGRPGEYVVLDKMGKRWRRKIDIYMGVDVEAARAWGRRRVRIEWSPPE